MSFWINNPSVLLNENSIFELYPTQKMTYEERLNAITRLVIILTIIGFIITASYPILFVGFITIATLVVAYKIKKDNIDCIKEGFKIATTDEKNAKIINPETLETFLKSDFEPTHKKNPMQNVLLTDIIDNPNRKSAPPSFSTKVVEDINKNTKKMIQELNPTIKNTNKQLFGDLQNKFDLDQSMINFYSTANTRVANDQTSFAEFLYGDMPSAKEGDPIQLLKDNFRYNLY